MSELSHVLTTGDVVKICHVAPRTVSKWIDSGELPGYRLPGSRDRRVYRDDLDAFMARMGMRPVLSTPRRLLMIGEFHINEILDVLESAGWTVRVKGSVFNAGREFVAYSPTLIIVDRGMGVMAATEVMVSVLPIPVLLWGRHERWTHKYIPEGFSSDAVVSMLEGSILPRGRLNGVGK